VAALFCADASSMSSVTAHDYFSKPSSCAKPSTMPS
jgi:hypothetical protein